MQLCLRGTSTHFLECEGSETIGDIKVHLILFTSKYIFS